MSGNFTRVDYVSEDKHLEPIALSLLVDFNFIAQVEPDVGSVSMGPRYGLRMRREGKENIIVIIIVTVIIEKDWECKKFESSSLRCAREEAGNDDIKLM